MTALLPVVVTPTAMLATTHKHPRQRRRDRSVSLFQASLSMNPDSPTGLGTSSRRTPMDRPIYWYMTTPCGVTLPPVSGVRSWSNFFLPSEGSHDGLPGLLQRPYLVGFQNDGKIRITDFGTLVTWVGTNDCRLLCVSLV